MQTMNRRMRQTQKERRRATYEPACDPTHYLVDIEDILGTFDEVVLYSRVSHRNQVHDGTLARHENWLASKVEEIGLSVIDSFDCQETSYDFSRAGRQTLVTAAEFALIHRAPLVTHALSRFLRDREWSFWNQTAQPTDEDFKRLKRLTGDVMLVTWLAPDAGHDLEHELFSTIRENQGGRPRTPSDRRSRHQREALRLFRLGYSLREVEGLLRVPKSTLQDWRNESKKQVYGFGSKAVCR
jgi:hypothetical protein